MQLPRPPRKPTQSSGPGTPTATVCESSPFTSPVVPRKSQARFSAPAPVLLRSHVHLLPGSHEPAQKQTSTEADVLDIVSHL